MTVPLIAGNPKVGILGGGQLGLMLGQAAQRLGIQCSFLEQDPFCPASLVGQVYHPDQLQQFIEDHDVFTLEFENTPVDAARIIEQAKGLYPNATALYTAQNRLREKNMFASLFVPVPGFCAVYSQQDIQTAVDTLGLPLVLKTSMGGYDGKGQYVLKSEQDISDAWQTLGGAGELIAEAFVPFEREVSMIAARGQDGVIVVYPLAENHHHQGILSHSFVPAPNSTELHAEASDYIARIMNHLNYVGVMTLELFVTEQGLVANEIAPRVHNSGHWSIEGAVCSQFENHIRAVVGLPLGATEIIAPTVMVNIIGQYPNPHHILSVDGAHVHLYHKEERAGRKIGHVTLMATTNNTLLHGLSDVADILPNPMRLKEFI